MSYGGFPEDQARMSPGVGSSLSGLQAAVVETSLTQKAQQIKELACGVRNTAAGVVDRAFIPSPDAAVDPNTKLFGGETLEGTLEEIEQVLGEAFRYVSKLNRKV